MHLILTKTLGMVGIAFVFTGEEARAQRFRYLFSQVEEMHLDLTGPCSVGYYSASQGGSWSASLHLSSG